MTTEPSFIADEPSDEERGDSAEHEDLLTNLIAEDQQNDMEDNDIRPLILFDLNGVLICESKRDDKLRRVTMSIRPEFEHILQLLPHYDVGIFSSATSRTVQRALGTLSSYLKDTRVVPPRMLDVLPGRQVSRLFSVVMDRSHCIPDPNWISRPDGHDYDTLKPLARNGLDPSRTLLVDNHARKAAPGEEGNVLVVPTWEHCRDSGVAAWNCLIDHLLVACKDGTGAPQDMRALVKKIGDELLAIHIAMPPPEEIDLDDNVDENEMEREQEEVEEEEEEFRRGRKLIKTNDDDISRGREAFPSKSLGPGIGSLAGEAGRGVGLKGAQPLYGSRQQHPSSNPPPRGGQGQFSKLHSEVESFASRACPTRSEMDLVARTLKSIKEAVCSLWPQATTCLFGSQASGLALPGSDLDVVILGVVEDLATPGSGFGKRGKNRAIDHLNLLASLLRKKRLVLQLKVIQARVPIIKAVFSAPDGPSIPADISIGVANGASAVSMVRHAVTLLPPLRPLVLVLKALLRETKLNEVFSGGLSSYSLVNMVIAHLQCEGFKAHGVAEAGRAPVSSAIVNSMGMMQEQGDFSRLIEKRADHSHDLGLLLTSFLHRFGLLFDYNDEAVSIASGGIVKKPPGWKREMRNRSSGPTLGIEDPQQAFRDIGSGSHNIAGVKRIFAEALSALEDGMEAAVASVATQPPPQSCTHSSSQGAALATVSSLKAVNALSGRGSPAMTERERWHEIQQDGQNISVDHSKLSSSRSGQGSEVLVNNAVQGSGPSVLDYVIDVNLCLARDHNAAKLRGTTVARLTQRKVWLRSIGKLPADNEGYEEDEEDRPSFKLEGQKAVNRKEKRKRKREEARSLNIDVSGLDKKEKRRVMKAARKELQKQQHLAPLHTEGVQKIRGPQQGGPKKRRTRGDSNLNGSLQPQAESKEEAIRDYVHAGKMGRPQSRSKGAALGLSKKEMKKARMEAEAQRRAQEIHLNPGKVAAEIEKLRSQLNQVRKALEKSKGNQGPEEAKKSKAARRKEKRMEKRMKKKRNREV